MSGRTVIELDGVGYAYADTAVLEGIHLAVAEREFLGIVGPNAGGKSTLLKVILGLLEPQAGRVRVLGVAPARASHRVGYLPQHPPFPRDFPISVKDTVLMGTLGRGRVVGGWPPAAHRAARRALEEVEADHLARRRIGTLSGGQLQRVLLARALAGDPEILLLDEPTANMDQRLESDIFELLGTLNARMTILVVSHDVAFISSHVSRVACVNRTLVCHHTDAIDGAVIQDLYGEDVRMVHHH